MKPRHATDQENNRAQQYRLRLSSLKAVNMGDRANLFISYRRNDTSDMVEGLARSLNKKLDATVFFDQEVRALQQWNGRVRKEVEDCDLFILLVGSKWELSKWIKQELHIALENDKPILPITVGAARLPQPESALQSWIQSRIARTQFGELDRGDPEAGSDKIAESIASSLGIPRRGEEQTSIKQKNRLIAGAFTLAAVFATIVELAGESSELDGIRFWPVVLNALSCGLIAALLFYILVRDRSAAGARFACDMEHLVIWPLIIGFVTWGLQYTLILFELPALFSAICELGAPLLIGTAGATLARRKDRAHPTASAVRRDKNFTDGIDFKVAAWTSCAITATLFIVGMLLRKSAEEPGTPQASLRVWTDTAAALITIFCLSLFFVGTLKCVNRGNRGGSPDGYSSIVPAHIFAIILLQVGMIVYPGVSRGDFVDAGFTLVLYILGIALKWGLLVSIVIMVTANRDVIINARSIRSSIYRDWFKALEKSHSSDQVSDADLISGYPDSESDL